MGMHIEELLTVTIEKLVQGGRGLARTGEGVVFIEGVLPGEKVSCRIVDRRKGYSLGKAVDILETSPFRIEPVCPHYGICGGCDFQHADDKQQAVLKEQVLRENMERLGGITLGEPIIVHRGESLGYRARARFHTDQEKMAVGFHGKKSRKVIPIEYCPILVHGLNSLLKQPNRLLSANRNPEGIYAAAEGDNTAVGTEPIQYLMDGKSFAADPGVFFQANPPLFAKLLEDFLTGLGGDTAMDLYSGVGVIASFLEKRFHDVTAVERNPACLKYARMNVTGKTSLYPESVELWKRRHKAKHIDLLAVDPPRSGLSMQALSLVRNIAPDRILYISCDAGSFSRDCGRLVKDAGYRLDRLEAYDLYPQTSHFETAALFSRQGV